MYIFIHEGKSLKCQFYIHVYVKKNVYLEALFIIQSNSVAKENKNIFSENEQAHKESICFQSQLQKYSSFILMSSIPTLLLTGVSCSF